MGIEHLLDLELELIKTFGWSLSEIDRTDTQSLLDLLLHEPGKKTGKKVYCDQVGFL